MLNMGLTEHGPLSARNKHELPGTFTYTPAVIQFCMSADLSHTNEEIISDITEYDTMRPFLTDTRPLHYCCNLQHTCRYAANSTAKQPQIVEQSISGDGLVYAAWSKLSRKSPLSGVGR